MTIEPLQREKRLRSLDEFEQPPWTRRKPKRRHKADRQMYLLGGLVMLATFGGGMLYTRGSGVSFVYYPSCSVARSLGAVSIPRDEPGYRDILDRDQDGLACEPHPQRP